MGNLPANTNHAPVGRAPNKNPLRFFHTGLFITRLGHDGGYSSFSVEEGNMSKGNDHPEKISEQCSVQVLRVDLSLAFVAALLRLWTTQ